MIDGMDELQGREVTITATGETGIVTAESFGRMVTSEDGIGRQHQLVVEITEPTCATCPHSHGHAIRHGVAVDASDVVLVS